MFRSNLLVIQSPVPRDPLARQNIPLHRPLHPGLRRGVPHAAAVAAAVDEPGADPGAQVHLLRRQAEVPHPGSRGGGRWIKHILLNVFQIVLCNLSKAFEFCPINQLKELTFPYLKSLHFTAACLVNIFLHEYSQC